MRQGDVRRLVVPCGTCDQNGWRYVEAVEQRINNRKTVFHVWECVDCGDGRITR